MKTIRKVELPTHSILLLSWTLQQLSCGKVYILAVFPLYSSSSFAELINNGALIIPFCVAINIGKNYLVEMFIPNTFYRLGGSLCFWYLQCNMYHMCLGVYF
jgi:hypothetical protein